jgi:phosphate/sulfate permease
MSFIFGIIGGILGIGGAIVLIVIADILGWHSSSFSLSAVVVSPLVGSVAGWLLYNSIEERQERKRIEYELEQDRIRYEQERQKQLELLR